MAYINGKQVCFSPKVNINYTEEELEAIRFDGWNSGMQQGYNLGLEEGYNNAVRTGTITTLALTKELKIEGLPSAPKTLSLFARSITRPETVVEGDYYIAGLDYDINGFYSGTNPNKRLGYLWITDINSTGTFMNYQERHVISENLITFENGTFTFKTRSSNAYYFGENYTYTWVATF